MDFRHLIVTCLFSMLRLPFDNQKVKENYATFAFKAGEPNNSGNLQAFRRWDYGGIVGMKAVIADHYTISFDYRVGIKKIQAQNGLRNSTFQFSVGYRF